MPFESKQDDHCNSLVYTFIFITKSLKLPCNYFYSRTQNKQTNKQIMQVIQPAEILSMTRIIFRKGDLTIKINSLKKECLLYLFLVLFVALSFNPHPPHVCDTDHLKRNMKMLIFGKHVITHNSIQEKANMCSRTFVMSSDETTSHGLVMDLHCSWNCIMEWQCDLQCTTVHQLLWCSSLNAAWSKDVVSHLMWQFGCSFIRSIDHDDLLNLFRMWQF